MNPAHRREPKGSRIDARMQSEVVDGQADPANFGRRRQSGRIAWFVLVGSAAAAVHWLVVALMVPLTGWHPLLANLVGWLVAVSVSFGGHHRWTFRGHGARLWPSAARFFAVSAMGFAINEAAYAALLHWTTLRYDLLLAAVLLAVAALTYWLSRHWVFLRSPAP